MRINKFIAQATGLSRRAADQAITAGQASINGQTASLGDTVTDNDIVAFNGKRLTLPSTAITLMLHKPVSYVCSRNGQGSRTIYDLLPAEYHTLKPIGRLDKDSSGLLLLTTDGQLANHLAHPRYAKEKVYNITLDKPLALADQTKIAQGIQLDTYTSHLQLTGRTDQGRDNDHSWRVTLSQGRNRQIRRTFAALGYEVTKLHRIQFGSYQLGELQPGHYQALSE
jgi:23S rRNA pseudouridine2605 synthase